jgi:hypothetical protein
MNAYPNDENYLQPSFGTPQETPSVDPDEGVLISVAYNPEWTKLLLGAVTQMRQYAAWAGTHDEKIETIERVNSLLFLLQNDITTVPAPFWDEDSADDSDDTAAIDDQPWYGQIVIIDDRLTFVENAFIYVVAGFIAYSGLPTSAIAFVPIARNFVVTMRSNPLGGIVRFLADAVEIGRVDTYAAADAALDVPVTMPPPAMGFIAEDVTYPTLWVELLEDNPHDLPSVSMTLVRSRLSEADFSNPNVRYNPDTDQLEQTPDGGVTWNPAPGLDPRHSTTFLKPPVGGSSKQCDSAANMVKWLHDFVDQMLFDFELVGSVTTIINSILLELEILAPYFELLGIVSELAETVSGIGATALAAAFTSDQYDLLQCIFFCRADADGRISAAQLVRVESDITRQLNTTAALVTNAILFVQGEIGLSNAGSVGSQTGSCDDCACGWCRSSDYTTDEDLAGMTNDSGVWSAGDGYVGTSAYGFVSFVQHYATGITGSTATHLEMTYSASGFGLGGNCSLQLYLAGTKVQEVISTDAGSHQSVVWDGTQEFDAFYLTMGSHDSGGVVKLEAWQLQGIDTEPEVGQVEC